MQKVTNKSIAHISIFDYQLADITIKNLSMATDLIFVLKYFIALKLIEDEKCKM